VICGLWHSVGVWVLTNISEEAAACTSPFSVPYH